MINLYLDYPRKTREKTQIKNIIKDREDIINDATEIKKES